MGRPINKRYFGTTGTGTGTGLLTGNNLPIRFKSGGTVYEGFIVKQVGSRRFKCSTDDGTTAVEKCLLTAGTSSDPVNNGEAVLLGLLNGSQPISIRELTNRIAIDFSSNRYKWTLTDDSTETLLILTAM
jgi:hypothetical protein